MKGEGDLGLQKLPGGKDIGTTLKPLNIPELQRLNKLVEITMEMDKMTRANGETEEGWCPMQ